PTRIVGPVFTDPVYGTIRPVTVVTYNLLGFRLRVKAGRTDSGGITPANDVVTTQMTYVWDDFGRKLRETDGLNRTWTMTYDVNNRPLTVLDAKNQTTTFAYDPSTRLLQTRTAGSHVTTYTRNALGQVLTATTP